MHSCLHHHHLHSLVFLFGTHACICRLNRNTTKLTTITKEYDKTLKECITGMDRACADRFRVMNGILARLVRFQV